jgi:hypothetical protein
VVGRRTVRHSAAMNEKATEKAPEKAPETATEKATLLRYLRAQRADLPRNSTVWTSTTSGGR